MKYDVYLKDETEGWVWIGSVYAQNKPEAQRLANEKFAVRKQSIKVNLAKYQD